MSRSNVIVPLTGDQEAAVGFASLIRALAELKDYAIARFVAKDGNKPLILLLAPDVQPDYECMVDIELPFKEDLRPSLLPSLDRFFNEAGEAMIKHRTVPSEKLLQAVGDVMDHMDLSRSEKDEDGLVPLSPKPRISLVSRYQFVLYFGFALVHPLPS